MTQKRKWDKTRRVFGVILVIIGFIALVTPFTPGAWLGLIGLGILLEKNTEEVLEWLKEKLSRVINFFKRGK